MESDANFNLYIKRQCKDDSSSILFNPSNSGLLRFSSAPTSLLEGYIDEKSTAEADRLSYSSSRLCSPDKANHMYASENNNKDVINRFAAVSSLELPPQYPRHSVNQLGPLMMEKGGYKDASSMSMEHHQVKVSLGNSILMKQNSSPAGWFTNLNSQSGYTTLKATGNSYRDQTNGDLNNRFNEEKVGNNSRSHDPFFNGGFPYASWNDSSNLADNSMIGGIKREVDVDQKLYSSSIRRNMERNRSQILSHHHLSLPTKDTVLCKFRAKRGCATHPRSIAERVRRTRISERMKKLQELVPNMDKQTNTADMLDLAVEYIKDLQRQYKMLSDSRAKCKCSASEILVPNHTL